MPDLSRPDLPRAVGFWGAIAVQVGVIIGSGIFRTPPQIADELGSPAIILLMWLAGGVLSLLGALTYAELAAMHPHSGGLYVFLREGFGRVTAFVFGWTYMLVGKPLAAGGIAFIFAESLNRLAGTNADPRLATSVMLVALTLVNIRGVSLSTGVAMLFTACKFGALVAIVLGALIIQGGDAANLAAQPAPKPLLNAFAPVMLAILWTYDGWADVNAIAGEVKNPARNLPRVLIVGTLAVTGIYIAVNAVYHWVLPMAAVRETDSVAPLVMGKLLGPAADIAVTALILLSTTGSTHSSIMTGARVTFAQARDGLLFAPLARVHPRFRTPAVALLVQLGLSVLAVWTLGSFESLISGFTFTIWIFYGLAGASIFVLRIRRPDAERPYRCPGYPVVPAVFVVTAAAMTGLCIREDPLHTLPWVGILLAGVPVYYAWRSRMNRALTADPAGPSSR